MGRGGFGVVYRVTDSKSGEKMAMRIALRSHAVDFGSDQATKDRNDFFDSPEFKQSQHLLNYSREQSGNIDTLSVVVQTAPELVPLTSILAQLKIRPAMSHTDIAKRLRAVKLIYEQATEGLRVLAEAGYSHRDIKPANLGLNGSLDEFLAGKARLVIFDYDLLQRNYFLPKASTVSGTFAYLAPELVAYEGQSGQALSSPMADFYALGNSIFEMLSGNVPTESEIASTVGTSLTSQMEKLRRIIRASSNQTKWNELVQLPIDNFFDKLRSSLGQANAVISIEMLQDLRSVESFVKAATEPDPEQRKNKLTDHEFVYDKQTRQRLRSVLDSNLTMALSARCSGLESQMKRGSLAETVAFGAVVGN